MFELRTRVLATLLAAVLVVPSVLTGCRPPPGAGEVEELLRQRNYAAARARVQQALTRDPKSGALWRLRIRIHLAQGQRVEAVEAYRERALNYGDDRDLLRRLGLALIGWGLESRVPEVRLAAIQAARETDAADLEESVAARLGDPDPLVRTWAAVALSGRRDGADVLDQQLQSSNPRAREIAVRELGRIAGAAALQSVLRATGDADARVRGAAASGLASIRRPESVEALRRLLHDPDAFVRADAARAAESIKANDLAPDLRSLTGDPHLSVRLSALAALSALGDAEAKPTLQALASSKDLYVALRAGLQLARRGSSQPVLNAVGRALVDKQWTIRVAACTTVSLLHDRVGLQLIEKALRDTEPRVRLAAARALLAGRPDLREPAVRTARSVQQLSCGNAARPPSVPELCIDASDLLVRAGHGDGMEMLKQLARRATTPELRLSALRGALLLAPNRWLALDGMADPDDRIALFAASWAYRRAK